MDNQIFITIGIVLVVFFIMAVVPQLIKNYNSWPARLKRAHFDWHSSKKGKSKLAKLLIKSGSWKTCAAGEIFNMPQVSPRKFLEDKYGYNVAEEVINLGFDFTSSIEVIERTYSEERFNSHKKQAIETYYKLRQLKNKLDAKLP